ncbi:MAG: ComF family protein [Bacteroidetes bacterium]|nr:ComF family protein [Bacteroidota bacterium]
MYKKFLNDIYNFVFPPFCPCCGSKQQDDKIICDMCEGELTTAEKSDLKRHYNEYFVETGKIKKLFSLYIFVKDSPIQSLIHKLKYENKFRIGLQLGYMWARRFEGSEELTDLDYIIPVPLFHTKKAERGYNQSYYFALGIKKVLGIKIGSRMLKRRRATDTQTNLSKQQRIINVKGAFKVKNKRRLIGKNILLFDDVITTGSTVNECARVLSEAGVKSIIAGSIALA